MDENSHNFNNDFLGVDNSIPNQTPEKTGLNLQVLGEFNEPLIIASGDCEISVESQIQTGATEKILLELEYSDEGAAEANAANQELLEFVSTLEVDGVSNDLSILSISDPSMFSLTEGTSAILPPTEEILNPNVNIEPVPIKPKTVFKTRYIHVKDVVEYDELPKYNKVDWSNKNKKRVIKCYNCELMFELWEFPNHVCYGGKSKDSKRADNDTKNENLREVDDDAEKSLRLTRENQIRIRRFLKDDLRYDVNAHITIIGESANTFNSKKYGPHECNLCERKFVHASGLLRHMEKHQMDLIPIATNPTRQCNKSDYKPLNNGFNAAIKCVLCGRIFFSPATAFEHLAVHFPYDREDQRKHVDQVERTDINIQSFLDVAMSYLACEDSNVDFIAGQCSWDEQFVESKYLKVIIVSCILQCEFCDFFFSDLSFLLVHSSNHAPNRNFECITCEVYGLSAKEITMHWQGDCIYMRNHFKKYSKNLSRYFVCNVCENKFPTLEYLLDHRQSSLHFFPRFNNDDEGVLYVSCEHCCLIINNVFEMVEHYEEKHCKRSRRGDRKDQSGTSKARQFLCEVCGKSYTQSSHLWQHLRFHQGIKPFACEEVGCTRKFTIRPDLNDHIRKCHTGERPYHCVDCGKRFLTGSVFYQHRLIHRGERRYKCDQCHKRFYRADALKNHQRIHTGEKPFSCIYCTKSFRQRGDRDKHIRARHAHLDNKSKLLLQMHKYHLEQKALKKKENPNQDNDLIDNSMELDMPMELDMSSKTMAELAAKWAAATP